MSTPEHPDQYPENWQMVSEIGWLGKEHFESFQAAHAELFSKSLAGASFNNCIQGGGQRIFSTEATSYGGRRITGFQQFTPRPGLTVAPRLDIGLGPYPRETKEYPSLSIICRKYAVEAYGFVATLQQENRAMFEKDDSRMQSRDIFLQSLAGSLATYLALD